MEMFSCDTAEKDCMMNVCDECKRGYVVDIAILDQDETNLSDSDAENSD